MTILSSLRLLVLINDSPLSLLFITPFTFVSDIHRTRGCVTSRKIHQIKLLAKNAFQNLFIAELEFFPAIRRPDTKPNLRPDTEINRRLNFPCSPRFSCVSLLVDATPGSQPSPRISPAPLSIFFSISNLLPNLYSIIFLSV